MSEPLTREEVEHLLIPQLAVVYPVPAPTPSQVEPPLSPRKAAVLADLFDVALLCVDAASINPERGIWGYGRWHPTPGDKILADHMAWLRAAGLTRQIYKWSWVPAHGTIDETIMFQSYTRGAAPWLMDENGDALIPGRNALDASLACVRNPTRVNPVWTTQYREHAMRRYGAAFEGWIDFNEPDDGFSNPGMLSLTQDEALRRIWTDVHQPGNLVHRRIGNGGLNIGPEAAYDDGLRRLLEMNRERMAQGSPSVWDIRTFHAYPPNDNATVDGALNELAIRRPIVLDICGKADASMTEIHDGGKGWFPEYFVKATSVYPELGLIAWLHSDETLFTPASLTPDAIKWDAGHTDGEQRSYLLSEWGTMLKAYMAEQRRRAVRS